MFSALLVVGNPGSGVVSSPRGRIQADNPVLKSDLEATAQSLLSVMCDAVVPVGPAPDYILRQ